MEVDLENLRDWADSLYIVGASLHDDGKASMAGIVYKLAKEISLVGGFAIEEQGDEHATD